MPGAVRRDGLTAARFLLATGLVVSAGLLSVVGGWWGLALGAAQAALAVAALFRPQSPSPLAGAMLSLVPAPLEAARHWIARLPVGCRCARLPHPPPGLVSVTGLMVVLDVSLLALTAWMTATKRNAEAKRNAEVGTSSP